MLSCFIALLAPVSANEYYYEETIEIIEEASPSRAVQTKTAKKTGTFKNANNQKLWSVTVTATFNYNGVSSVCTKSSASAAAYTDAWKISSKSSSKSANTGSATAIAKCYLNGQVISTGTKTVTLTCSVNGTLS